MFYWLDPGAHLGQHPWWWGCLFVAYVLVWSDGVLPSKLFLFSMGRRVGHSGSGQRLPKHQAPDPLPSRYKVHTYTLSLSAACNYQLTPLRAHNSTADQISVDWSCANPWLQSCELALPQKCSSGALHSPHAGRSARRRLRRRLPRRAGPGT